MSLLPSPPHGASLHLDHEESSSCSPLVNSSRTMRVPAERAVQQDYICTLKRLTLGGVRARDIDLFNYGTQPVDPLERRPSGTVLICIYLPSPRIIQIPPGSTSAQKPCHTFRARQTSMILLFISHSANVRSRFTHPTRMVGWYKPGTHAASKYLQS